MIDFSQNAARIPAAMKQRVMVGEKIENVEITSLRINPMNTDTFKRESEEYFHNLTEDIRKRGIIVPLLAKKDGTLLAGHNRLEIAQRLGLKYVPVQYVQEQLSPDAEREFLIKDNLFRRQFSGNEWIEIYRRLVPDYDMIIYRDGRGGDRKSQEKNITTRTKENIKKDSVLFDMETATQEDLIYYLHRETGTPIETIRKRIQRDKKATSSHNRKTAPSLQKATSSKSKENNIDNHTIPDTSSITALEKSLQRIASGNEATKKEALKKLRAFIKILR